jgi:hypothetical protein
MSNERALPPGPGWTEPSTGAMESGIRKPTLFPTKEEWAMIVEQSSIVWKSGIAGSMGLDRPEQVIAIALKGWELGLPLMTSLEGIHLVRGKPQLDARLMQSMAHTRIKGAKIQWDEIGDKGRAVVTAHRAGWDPITVTYTAEDAKREGMADDPKKPLYRTQLPAMLRAGCLRKACRMQYPEINWGFEPAPEPEETTHSAPPAPEPVKAAAPPVVQPAAETPEQYAARRAREVPAPPVHVEPKALPTPQPSVSALLDAAMTGQQPVPVPIQAPAQAAAARAVEPAPAPPAQTLEPSHESNDPGWNMSGHGSDHDDTPRPGETYDGGAPDFSEGEPVPADEHVGPVDYPLPFKQGAWKDKNISDLKTVADFALMIDGFTKSAAAQANNTKRDEKLLWAERIKGWAMFRGYKFDAA